MKKLLAAAMLIARAWTQNNWHDPSPHRVEFVKVEDNVRLEMLDWGGRGPNLVLLAGRGNTAHVFDDFAVKLSAWGHVYGITRRGFGASGQPPSGYTDQRLADDVLAVLESLHIAAPVLVGHSLAGSEMTTLAGQHPTRIAGLVYLDSAFDPTDTPDASFQALADKLPSALVAPPAPTLADRRSALAYQEWQRRNGQDAFPESELHNVFFWNADGSMGRYLTPARVFTAILDGAQKRDYSKIRVPVLAFFTARIANPVYQPGSDGERAAIAAFEAAADSVVNGYEQRLRRARGSVRIVDLRQATHYVFLSNELDVLREIRTFLAGLAPAAGDGKQP